MIVFLLKAWGAICELLGDEDKIDPKASLWSDAFIVNLGRDEYKDLDIHPKDLENWHVDGDFFVSLTCRLFVYVNPVTFSLDTYRCIFWILRSRPY